MLGSKSIKRPGRVVCVEFDLHEIRALHSHFINYDLAATKQAFYLCGRLSGYRVTSFDSDFMNYDLSSRAKVFKRSRTGGPGRCGVSNYPKRLIIN